MIQNLPKMKVIATEICNANGCQLYDLEFSPGSKGKGRRVLVYLEKSGGVSLDDCEKVSKSLEVALDEQSLIPDGEYSLEVSSPGLERPLKEKWHFEAVKGQTVAVQTTESIVQDAPVKRMKVTGKLEDVNDSEIKVAADGNNFVIPLNTIKKANVVFDYDSLKIK